MTDIVQSVQSGLVPLLDEQTGRFPDEFAPPSVAADATAAQDAAEAAGRAQEAAEAAENNAAGHEREAGQIVEDATATIPGLISEQVTAQIDPKVAAVAQAKTDAETARGAAQTARDDALQAKAQALAAQQAAAGSAGAAATSAGSASGSADAAAGSAGTANQRANDAGASASAAAESAGQAQQSAQAAEGARDGMVIGGRVEGADLILTTVDESEINVGNVRGPSKSVLLTQRERMAKGGVVGVGDRAVVTLRYDDWHNVFQSTVFPLLTARALPAGFVCISRFQTEQPWGNATTWDQVREWTKRGIEIWSHGTDHKDPTLDGDAGIYREIVTSKAEIEAQGIKVVGFAPPGATPVTEAQPFGTKWASPEDYDTYCGRLIQATYGISDGYMAGAYRVLPHGVAHGLMSSIILTEGGTTKAQALAVIDKAIERRQQVQLFSHAGNIGSAGNMSLADYTEVLDYLVTKRDAGLLEVLTPSAAYFGSQDTERRLDLYRHGGWEGISTGDSRWTGWSTKEVRTDGGHGGSNYLRILNADTGYISLLTSDLHSLGVSGEQFMFEVWVRCQEGGAAVVELRVADSQNLSLRPAIAKTKTISGTGWQKFMFPFGLYTTQDSIHLAIRRVSGSGPSLDVDDVRVYKI